MPDLKLEMEQIVHNPCNNKAIKTGSVRKTLTVGFGVKIPADADVGKNVVVKMHFSGVPSEVLSLLKNYPLDPNLQKKAKVLCTLSTSYQTSADIITNQAEKKVKAKAKSEATKEEPIKPPSSLEGIHEKLVDVMHEE